MTIYFSKIKDMLDEEHILVFKQGEFQNPMIILSKNDIEKLNEEWKRKI